MVDAVKYNSLVAWRTIAKDVVLLTQETTDDSATYRITVAVVDTNDVGQPTKQAGFYFTDYYGIPYRIVAVNTNNIDVSDDFRTKHCPISGHTGIVHRSAYKGYSLYLPAESFRHLHPLAASNNNKYAMSILWGNDPNGRRIPFTDTTMPSIADYRANIVDEDGVTFNPMEDYGQNPQFEIWQVLEDGTYSQLSSYPNVTKSLTDGLIDSVLFSGTGELITGYILIKN